MITPKRLPLVVRRNSPLHLMCRVEGLNLSGAIMRFAVKLYPDNVPPDDQIPPLLVLEAAAINGGEGIRLVDVSYDEGIPTSRFEVIAAKSSIQALPPSADAGTDLQLFYDFDWLRVADDSGWSMLEETVLYGPFTVKGSANV